MSEQKDTIFSYPPRKKLFYKNIILVISFVTAFVIYVLSCFFTNRGVFSDIPACYFCGCFSSNSYFYFHDVTARVFSFILAAVPYNIFLQFVNSFNLLEKLNLFYISYLIMSGVLTALNFYVAKFTKRYDIAFYTLFVYSFFYLPGNIWSIREIFIAFPIWFILLQFFVCKERLNIFAKIVLIFCLLFCFESFELFVSLGALLFVFSILFAIKKDKNYIKKLYIGIISLIASLYIIIKTLLIATRNYNLSESSNQWLSHILVATKNVFSSNFCISLFGLVLIFIWFNENISKRYKVNLSLFSFFLLILRLYNIESPFTIESNFYSYLLFVLPLIFFFVLCEEYFNFKILKAKKFITLFIISLIVGICHFVYQTKENIDFYNDYFIFFKTFLNNNKGIIQKKPEEIFSNFTRFDYDFTMWAKSIIAQSANPDKKITTIILEPSSDIYYDTEMDFVCFMPMKINFSTETEDYDLTAIKKELIKMNKVK